LVELFEDAVMEFGHLPEIVRDNISSALVDGKRGVGQITGTFAMDVTIKKARTCGIGFVSLRGGADYGMASNYAIQAMEQGMIGISMSTGPVLVAPWGGRDALFSTNPISLAAPGGERDPIVIDMATSANSMGKAVLAARDGKRLAGEELVDSEGHYTNDPSQVILDSMARESGMAGALLPAGPKGFGMVLIVELLASLLSGERTWLDETPTDGVSRASYYGQSYIAIDIEKFQSPSEFAATADRMIETLTSSRSAHGFEHVRVHGGNAAEVMRDSLAHGIYLRDEEWQMVLDVAKRLNLQLPT
jgi:LDH2 family malate/lactate/ureidoglycolate dehydrogenase